jgi:hypothetical protein
MAAKDVVSHVGRRSPCPPSNPPKGSAARRGSAPPFPIRRSRASSGCSDQHVLHLLVVVEHHLVVLAPDARLLVAAERRMRRIGVEAVCPDATGLDRAAEPPKRDGPKPRRPAVCEPNASGDVDSPQKSRESFGRFDPFATPSRMTASCANETALSTQVAAQIDRRLIGFESSEENGAGVPRKSSRPGHASLMGSRPEPARLPSPGETGEERRHRLAILAR